MLSVVFSDNARRFPDIRFIFSHAGGTLPLLIDRGNAVRLMPSLA
ncbi:MAG: hypothetical protein ACKVQU_09955 [Burkholderiales bacterium]